MLTGGYAWLPGLRRRTVGPMVHTRVMGQRAVALRGPEAVRFFYDERHVARATALPEPVQATLTGKRAVHTLDGPAHRERKSMFMSVLADQDRAADLVEQVCASWDERAGGWPGLPRVVVFDEAARALGEGVCRWAGVPLGSAEVDGLARDMVTLVDGFATLAPRHWLARRVRAHREEWLAGLLGDRTAVPAGSVADIVRQHRENGERLNPLTAAVELLGIIRPTVAVAWYVAFAAHAMHRWPQNREWLKSGDPAYADAFAQEVRRFYPFAPYVAARAVKDLTWVGEPIPEGTLILLDLYGQNHDAGLWDAPYSFDPERFVGATVGRDDLVPQGGGDPYTGHRCPGEAVTVALLRALAVRLARLRYTVPPQDLSISLRRIPTRPRSGFVITGVHTTGAQDTPVRTPEPAARPSGTPRA